MAEKKADEQTFSEKLLFYTTASFILLATFSLFAFLFLVPFVIEPAFTTIFMEFDEEPAFCITMSSITTKGQTNCSSWTSCKEGCTKEVYECTQITVKYKLSEKVEVEDEAVRSARVERALRPVYPDEYEDDLPPGVEDESFTGLAPNGSEWYYIGARLFPNVKGCGYPPMLNCSVWMAAHVKEGSNFSCYYSRLEPGLVITDLDMWQVYMNLVYAMAIPIPSFIVSVIYLVMAYFYIYNEEPEEVDETTPLPVSTPVPPPTSGALTPASEVFREDLASFGHQLKVAMADDISRESIFTDSVPLSTNSINGTKVFDYTLCGHGTKQLRQGCFDGGERSSAYLRPAPIKAGEVLYLISMYTTTQEQSTQDMILLKSAQNFQQTYKERNDDHVHHHPARPDSGGLKRAVLGLGYNSWRTQQIPIATQPLRDTWRTRGTIFRIAQDQQSLGLQRMVLTVGEGTIGYSKTI